MSIRKEGLGQKICKFALVHVCAKSALTAAVYRSDESPFAQCCGDFELGLSSPIAGFVGRLEVSAASTVHDRGSDCLSPIQLLQVGRCALAASRPNLGNHTQGFGRHGGVGPQLVSQQTRRVQVQLGRRVILALRRMHAFRIARVGGNRSWRSRPFAHGSSRDMLAPARPVGQASRDTHRLHASAPHSKFPMA